MSILSYFLGILFIFLSICYAIVFLNAVLREKRWRVASRLQVIQNMQGSDSTMEPLNLPFSERIIKPAFLKIGEWVESLTPTRMRKSLSDRLIAAGYINKAAMTNFITIQCILAFLVPLVFIFFSMILTLNQDRVILSGILGFLMALFFPVLILESRKNERQNKIRKNLPDVLDLLVVSMEAGLGFDMALAKVVEKSSGVLADEFNNVLNEVRLGKVRRIALQEMADRTGVEELISFVGAIVQADQLGVSISHVLRVQADAIRTKRRQRIEEQAAKAPIQLLFPLIFCIFPAMFVVLLGPAAIQFMQMFAEY